MQPGTSQRALCAVVPLALLLAACGPTTPLTGGPTPTPSPEPDLVARLDNLPVGVVRVQQEPGSRRLLAHLDMSGLVPRTAHAVQLRRGTCLQRGGPLLAAFADATSNAAGGMSADVLGPAAPLAGGEYLELHLVGASKLAAGAVPIACADISATAPTAGARMTATPGYKPFGSVSITYTASDRSATLAVSLQALVGRTHHAVEILTGTCTALGQVVQPAGDVSADAGGTVKATLALSGMAGPPPPTGWVVVVRSGAGDAIGTAAQPTAQAQPILCGPFAKAA